MKVRSEWLHSKLESQRRAPQFVCSTPSKHRPKLSTFLLHTTLPPLGDSGQNCVEKWGKDEFRTERERKERNRELPGKTRGRERDQREGEREERERECAFWVQLLRSQVG